MTCPPPLAAALAAAWGTAGPGDEEDAEGGAAAAAAAWPRPFLQQHESPQPPQQRSRRQQQQGVGGGGSGGGRSPSFSKLAWLCGEPGTEPILADTLYRACVLLSPPPPAAGEGDGGGGEWGRFGRDWLAAAERGYGDSGSAAWAALHAALWAPLEVPAPVAAAAAASVPGWRQPRGTGRAHKQQLLPPTSASTARDAAPPRPWALAPAAAAAVRGAFAAHQRECGLWGGAHPLLRRARRRLARLPGAAGLLTGLLAAHPAARPTLRAALLSEAFACLRVEPQGEAGASAAGRASGGSDGILCTAFGSATEAEEGRADAPMLPPDV